MTSNVKLLPLPEKVEVDKHLPTGVRIYAYDADTLRTYARANMEPLIAEIEALRAEREVICAEAVKYADKSGRLEAKVDRLVDELRKITELRERHHDNLHDAVTIAEEALRDHEQEVGDGRN